jgi:Na+-translocating ferredoxin:NAD+ oxidoreductase RnfA subunit
LLRFSILLLIFTVATAALFHPIDQILPVTWWYHTLRPLIVIGITCVLYVLALIVLHFFPSLKRRMRHLLPLAVFNNTVVGVSLLLNLQVSVSFWLSIALAAGAAVGFLAVSAITAEAVERMDNPDIPAAFRGLPATLVYMGLLALALMGFQSVLKFT